MRPDSSIWLRRYRPPGGAEATADACVSNASLPSFQQALTTHHVATLKYGYAESWRRLYGFMLTVYNVVAGESSGFQRMKDTGLEPHLEGA